MPYHAGEHIDEAFNIVVIVHERLFHRLSHRFERRKVDHTYDIRVLLKHLLDRIGVTEIHHVIHYALAGDRFYLIEDLGPAICVIIDGDNVVPRLKQCCYRMAADITRAACYKYFGHSVNCITSPQINKELNVSINHLSSTSFEKLKDIARTAGEVILEVYGQDDFQIESKDDSSPVTVADRKANTVICAGLEQLGEQYPIVSEENKDVPYQVRSAYTEFWLVDPLDGTKEFIKRNGEFTVNIALISNGRPVASVVYVPVTGVMYSAHDGKAYMEADGLQRELSAAQFRMKDKSLGVVCSRSHLNDETREFIERLDAPETVSKGSSLKFTILAEGKAHLYPRIAPTMEWDTAAAQAVLEAAGGKVVEYETGQPLRYNKEVLLNPYFLATGVVLD